METIKFYKTEQGWFADIPQYLEVGGNIGDLQMVLGADDFLAELANGEDDITLHLTTNSKEIRNWEGLPEFVQHGWEFLTRADYVPASIGKYYTAYNSKYLWLCPITEFVFGEYPKYIYYKIKTEKDENYQGQLNNNGSGRSI